MRKSASIIMGDSYGPSASGVWTVCHLDRSVKMIGTLKAVVTMLLPAGTSIIYNDGWDDNIIAIKGKITKKALREFSSLKEDWE